MFRFKTFPVLAAACAFTLCGCGAQQSESENVLLKPFNTPEGAPAFDQIKLADYEPAYQAGWEEHNNNIEKIVNCKEAPTFENTILAMDDASPILNRVEGVFGNLSQADTYPEMTALAAKLAPISAAHYDEIMLNEKLFKRVAAVYKTLETEKYTPEQRTLIKRVYDRFARNGAALNEADKARVKEINGKLASLTMKFSNNLLDETNRFKLVIKDSTRLSGIPAWLVQAAKEEAKKADQPEAWIFTLQTSNRIPILQYADDRNIRKEMYQAYTTKGDHNDELDNKAILKEVLTLRAEKAQLLGFKDYASYILDNNMAKKPEAVMALLKQIWDYALPKAKNELKDMQKLMSKLNPGQKMEAWDWWYYTEKLRAEKFSLSEDELKPYLTLENVRKGAFMCAEKLYGIKIVPADDIQGYTEGVESFRVLDADGSLVGVFYSDYFPRAGKRGGAWMNNYRGQKKGQRPIITNVCSFTPPVGDTPSMLTVDEVETLFHEFGHALHGLLSQCDYYGTSGTSVARDFVELPSQINEHWSMHPEVLKMYAKHYKTGEVMPDALIKKLEATHGFNQGFVLTELLAAAMLDMELHMVADPATMDINKFEKDEMKKIGLIAEIAPRYRATYFNHIMGGYAAGYYAYTWANVLDCDAFASFEETSTFDKKTAMSFRKNILEKGGSEDPMELYKRYKGAEPTVAALLRMRGLK